MKKYNIQLIFVAAIIVAILFNFRTVGFLMSALEEGSFQDLSEGGMRRLWMGVIHLVFHAILFLSLAFFNYSWKERLIPQNLSKTVRTILIILANLLIFVVLVYLENILIEYVFADSMFIKKRRHHSLGYFLFANVSIAGLAVSAAYLILLAQKIRRAEVENTRLKEEKANAELAALKEQLSPHFFFNTLSSLSNVIRNEKKEVGLEFIQEMSKTYRYTLASKRQDLVALSEEMEFVNAYLFLLKKRFNDKLQVDMNITEQYLSSKIPPMSLQLLVENAVQHNIMTKDAPLNIHFFVEEEHIIVENNLQHKNNTNGLGLGLENLSNRYRLLAQKAIFIEKDEEVFRVKLPLL